IVPYLKHIGISHLYATPIIAAAQNTTHLYDVVDHNRFDPLLGGEDVFMRLSDTLKDHGLGLILDIVPNHMAASTGNPWWTSVLEWGEASPYARHFDIDWQAGPLTLPFLGDSFEACLGKHELSIGIRGDGRIVLEYYDNWWPLCPHSWPLVLDRIGDSRFAPLGRTAAEADPDATEAMHEMVLDLVQQSDFAIRVEAVSRDPDLIEAVHEAQPWRLFDWHEGRRHLTYRRFFEITGLVGVRVEDEKVFDDVHRTVLALTRGGRIDGLRIDHVDGLADPTGYLKRLRQAVGPDVPIFVEKILEVDESLPPDWPVQGTTGYEFIAALAGLFTDGSKAAALDHAYRTARGERPDYAAERLAAKTEIVTWNLEGELDLLTKKAAELAAHLAPDLADPEMLGNALGTLLTAFPVYRTYVNADGVTSMDAERLDAVEAGLKASTKDGNSPEGLAFLFRLLRLDVPDGLRPAALDFTIRFQQTTSPVMAKAVEDTLFYRSSRLIALNEVGGDPEAVSGGVAAFHEAMEQRAGQQPQGLSTTATHDTKRGEDARARLYTISEAPENWADAVNRWRHLQAGMVKTVDRLAAPEPETEWMLYQALLGGSPIDRDDNEWLDPMRERFLAFVEKAMREDKRRTGWTKINTPYETAVLDYARRLLDPGNETFLEDFVAKTLPFVVAGLFNSMAQTLIKLTAPGIPDIYDGSESWDFSFVDPDNRRPVDFQRLALTLERRTPWPLRREDALDGSIKQHLIASVLKFRGKHAALFAEGNYVPVAAFGPNSDHILAFLRRHGDHAALTVLPRLVLDLVDENHGIPAETWDHAWLDLGSEFDALTFTNGLTGETIIGTDLKHVSAAFGTTPVGFFITQ
ncbi:MAG TPA: malto-oligosyltrehalose synthase, partial [Pararhizobium sp.]|nr:malto-oligosyltrehalose synthase [Pararhizobium sp.]